MGCNPVVEQLHCFQSEQYGQHHRTVAAALVLMLGVNGALEKGHDVIVNC